MAVYECDGGTLCQWPYGVSDKVARRMIARNGTRPDFRDSRDGTGTRIAQWTNDDGRFVKVTMVPNAYAANP